VELLSSTGTVLKSATSTNPLTGDTVVTATGLAANTTYYVRVSAGRTDAFAVGTYQLRVGFNYDPVTETKAAAVQALGTDGGSNDSQAAATTLTATPGYTANTHYSASARTESKNDVDFYKLTTPATTGLMTLTVQGLEGLTAKATVYSSSGLEVLSNVILNWENGLYRSQATFLGTSTTYFIKVEVQDPDWSAWSGDYFLDVDFKQPVAVRDTVAVGTATRDSQIAYGFEIGESRAFTFALHAASTNTAVCDWFAISIYDSTGKQVANLGTDGLGSIDTLTVFLNKGKYSIKFVPVFSNNSATASVFFRLSTALISDPIDVYDPTVPPPPPTSPPFTTITFPPASPPPPGFYDPWSPPIP
jgi:hypothetical protein